jgi:hypothetical protein
MVSPIQFPNCDGLASCPGGKDGFLVFGIVSFNLGFTQVEAADPGSQ